MNEHSNNIEKIKNEDLYTIAVIPSGRAIPIPNTLQEIKALLKGAAIENNTLIPNRSDYLPAYTLVLNYDGGNNNSSYRVLREDGHKAAEKIYTIYKGMLNNALKVDMSNSKENSLSAASNENKHKIVYTLSEEDAQKLHGYGIPIITYKPEARSEQFASKGKVLGGIRQKAFEKIYNDVQIGNAR